MGIKFFGQFLLENGEIEPRHLKDVGDLMYWVNRKLGELAAKKNYMTRTDVERIHRAQLSLDLPFGELAVQLGLLTREQVDELIEEQNATQLRVGEALVELGYLDQERLKQLLERYDAEQTACAEENERVPEELRDSPTVEFMLDQVPKIALRTALFRVKIGMHRAWAGSESRDYRACISIRGDDAIDVGITVDQDFMKAFASTTHESDADEPSREALTYMLSAFLKVVAKSARTGLEKRRIELEVALPRVDVLPSAGFAFELVSLQGSGLLIIAKP